MPLSPVAALIKIDRYLLALVATVILASLLPATGIGADMLARVTYVAIAILFFLYGARLSRETVIAGIANWRLQILVLLSTFALFPVLAIVLTKIFGGALSSPALASGILFIGALPSTVQSSIAFTSIAKGNVAAAICAASLSNLLGVIVTPALLALIASTAFTMDGRVIIDLALQLLVPFVLGQVVRPWIGDFLNRHKKIGTLFDRGSILLVVYGAFSAGMAAGIWSLVDWHSLAIAFGLDLLLLASVLIITTYASRWLGFSTPDEVAIVFCGSKKSMASGIPMANILFPAATVGLVVLPLMLFHQAQLFACSWLASRYAARERARAVERQAARMPRAAQ